MPRRVLLPFLALALFVIAVPAALSKPGLPLFVRGDEAGFLGLSYSLLADRDFVFEAADAERIFGQFPFDPGIEVRLAMAEGVRRFDAPLLYPLLAVPVLALLGSNGLLVLNLALLLAAAALAANFLERRGLDGGFFFAAPFALLSPALIYAFWMRPGALLFFLGTAAVTEGWADQRPLPTWRRACAGAALGLAAAHLPYLLLLAAPLLLRLFRVERKNAAAFALALAAAFLLLTGAQYAATGAPVAGSAGQVYSFDHAADEPWRRVGGAIADPAPRAFSAERLLISPIERRRGFLPYFPLALLALALWRPGRREGWLLAALAAALAVQPWVGQLAPGLPMNPALLPLYPAFLVFVTRIPRLAVIGGAAAATYLLGLQIFGLLGSPIPDGGAHGHVRAFPFPYLPLDAEEIQPGSGLWRVELSGDEPAPVLWAAADQSLPGSRELWTYGGERVELYLESQRPLGEVLVQMRSEAVPNLIELRHAGGEEVYDFAAAPAVAQRRLALSGGEQLSRGTWLYRLVVESRRGAKPYWSGESASAEYIGAAIVFMGKPAELERDLYHVDWQSCAFRREAPAGFTGLALVRAKNASAFVWPSRGAARIRFASRWLDESGNRVAENPSRSAILHPVEPGGEVALWLKVKTPETPGRYWLEFDAVYEMVAWFSVKSGEPSCRQLVEVVPRQP